MEKFDNVLCNIFRKAPSVFLTVLLILEVVLLFYVFTFRKEAKMTIDVGFGELKKTLEIFKSF